MAHFYGTLEGSRGMATRCGTKSSGMRVVAASWSGAVKTVLAQSSDDKTIADVSVIPWHGHGPRIDDAMRVTYLPCGDVHVEFCNGTGIRISADGTTEHYTKEGK